MMRLLITLFLVAYHAGLLAQGLDIYVAPHGHDTCAGTHTAPLATLQMALRKAREARRLHFFAKPVHIYLMGGTYPLHETVFIRTQDGGTRQSPTQIMAVPGEAPLLSGGIPIKHWKKTNQKIPRIPAQALPHLWEANVPRQGGRPFYFRQLWINGTKATKAKSANGALMHRILNWNKNDQTCLIPAEALKGVTQADGLEFFIHQWWAIAVLRVQKIETSASKAQLWFHQPESRIQSEHPWPAPWLSTLTGNSAFYLSNAPQFLDEPGEWWLDEAKGKLYYWPLPGQDMYTAEVVAPALETLVQIEGTAEAPVKHLTISGLKFAHTTWLRPAMLGHVPHQTGMYMTDAYKLKPPGTPQKPALDNQAWIGRPAAAVSVNFAHNLSFEGCSFMHMATTGLDYHQGVKHSSAIGNLFKDIGGTAVLAGVFAAPGSEIHVPYNPASTAHITEQLTIENNLITNAANEDWSCVGIGLGYVRHTRVEHNEVEHVSYSGISIGWGWTADSNLMRHNRIAANYVHHFGKHNYDCAGIYTLSAQPGTAIEENVVDSIIKAPYAHLPSHWFYLYTDEGSSGITVANNWTPAPKFLQNANGPGITWQNNGPQVSALIKQQAGLQMAYRHLTAQRSFKNQHFNIQFAHPEVMELVFAPASTPDIPALKQFLRTQNLDTSAIYVWQNHVVLFTEVPDLGVLQDRLQKLYPQALVKPYYDMFYAFKREQHCQNSLLAKEWEHLLFTASLVNDELKQQQYLQYHHRQLYDWPQVSAGFCNAHFQQVLLFKHHNQLVLVISIPKGKTLEELNPLTTLNNPQMQEWNKRMQQYQQGIKEAPPGQIWVPLKAVN
ncbi:MAG TPA: right-handed parallel beta-helix repeat-containing protein [Phnomibacter sp.]|nr:right-handed parallel beta-helix repeat-containing protein [Phnomibacter sp.]